MKKKLFNILLTISLIGASIGPAYAADPKILFEVDCDTLNKVVQVGYESDPADPGNGPEIIAFEFTMSLEPVSGTVLGDLANAKFVQNSAFSNIIIAQNTSKEVGNKRELKIAGGFTQQTGATNPAKLLSIGGTNQKSYKITVLEGKLFPKDGGDDIFKDDPPQQTFSADPSICQTQAGTSTQPPGAVQYKNVVIQNFSFTPDTTNIEVGKTVIWTNNDSTVHTVHSIGAGPLNSGNLNPGDSYSQTFTEKGTYEYQCNIHPSMRGRVIVVEPAQTTTGTTTALPINQVSTSQTNITISSDTVQANPGDEVVVIAIIEDLQGSIDWSQTAGTRIQPEIKNESLPDNKTKSTLTFSMPTPATDVTLRIKVGDSTEPITIKGTDTTTTAAADAQPGGVAGTETESLEERLRRRREEQLATAEPTTTQDPSGTVYSAAGSELARSGPEHTAALVIISMGIVFILKRRRKKTLLENA